MGCAERSGNGQSSREPVVGRDEQSKVRQLVVTLSVPNDEVIKVEQIDASGERREITEQEFAELAGEDEAYLGAALEEAYEAGVRDAIEEEYGDGCSRQGAGPQLLVLQDAAVRRLILHRALQRLAAANKPERKDSTPPSQIAL
jgi:hypothetical protein